MKIIVKDPSTDFNRPLKVLEKAFKKPLKGPLKDIKMPLKGL
jgi:hypothetical protein